MSWVGGGEDMRPGQQGGRGRLGEFSMLSPSGATIDSGVKADRTNNLNQVTKLGIIQLDNASPAIRQRQVQTGLLLP